MGLVILARAIRPAKADPRPLGARALLPLGGVGGFLDAIGGGGWGPIVTTALIGARQTPRYVIGTVNAAEFLVTVAISATFVVALVTGHWSEAEGLFTHAWAVGGLIAGGVLAAPLAGFVTKHLPLKALTAAVGVLVMLLAAYQLARMLHWV